MTYRKLGVIFNKDVGIRMVLIYLFINLAKISPYTYYSMAIYTAARLVVIEQAT